MIADGNDVNIIASPASDLFMHNENTIITVAAVKSTATLIKGKLGGASVDLMLDSGSSVSLIQIDALKGACNVVQVSSARPIQLVRISCCSLFTNRFHMFSNADTSPSRSCQPTQSNQVTTVQASLPI